MPYGAIPRQRLCRAFMKKFQIQRYSYGKYLISSFVRSGNDRTTPRPASANNRESNRKRTAVASCRRQSQHLFMPGAEEVPTRDGRGGRSRDLAKRNQNMSPPLGKTKPKYVATPVAPVRPWIEPERCPGAVADLRYSGIT